MKIYYLPQEIRYQDYPWAFKDGTKLRYRLHNFKFVIIGPGSVRYVSSLPTKGATMAISIAEKVAEQISGLGPSVEADVIEALVERESKRRSTALVDGIDKLAKLENELKRLKPDIVQYDEKGQIVSSTFSKARYDEMKKANEQIEKLTKAINKALEKEDFSDLYNMFKQQSPGGDKSASDKKDSSGASE